MPIFLQESLHKIDVDSKQNINHINHNPRKHLRVSHQEDVIFKHIINHKVGGYYKKVENTRCNMKM